MRGHTLLEFSKLDVSFHQYAGFRGDALQRE
jgi:hypothetical protein